MPHRLLEPLAVTPIVVASTSALTGSAAPPADGWLAALIGPASGLVVSLLVLWFLKGYYDRSLTREAENRLDVRELLERVIRLSEKQHEQGERCLEVIEENTQQTRATKEMMTTVASTLTRCHEKHQ